MAHVIKGIIPFIVEKFPPPFKYDMIVVDGIRLHIPNYTVQRARATKDWWVTGVNFRTKDDPQIIAGPFANLDAVFIYLRLKGWIKPTNTHGAEKESSTCKSPPG